MLSADVRQCTEDVICNMLQDAYEMEEGEQKDRAVANAVKLMHQLDDFNKTDLEEQKDLRKCEIEKTRIESEHETKIIETQSNKQSRKEKRVENIIKVLGIVVPLGTAVTCELFKVHNLNKGYAFEERDQVQTSPTFRTVWQKP